jgi:hypothetical protein
MIMPEGGQPRNKTAWQRQTPRRRALFSVVFTAEIAALIALVFTFGLLLGLTIWAMALVPIVLAGLALPIWWALTGKTFPS